MVPKPGRRADRGEPSIAIPPALPPSVEEAYRRKCLQLKRRTNEVEEDNEAARLRLARLRRGVEKLRLERAFLLDQLAKRTSTNVEDSDGSPSPPPTVRDEANEHNGPSAHAHSPSPASTAPAPHPLRASSVTTTSGTAPTTTTTTTGHQRSRLQTSGSAAGSASGTNHALPNRQQPQEKPLRSKRGHRKPSVVADLERSANGPPPTFINQGLQNLSPSSDAFSHSVTAGEAGPSSQHLRETTAQRANGVGGGSKTAKKPANAFDLYCVDHREAAEESKSDDATVDEELSRGWEELPESRKEVYRARVQEAAEAKTEEVRSQRPATAESQEAEETPARDDDVEMDNED